MAASNKQYNARRRRVCVELDLSLDLLLIICFFVGLFEHRLCNGCRTGDEEIGCYTNPGKCVAINEEFLM